MRRHAQATRLLSLILVEFEIIRTELTRSFLSSIASGCITRSMIEDWRRHSEVRKVSYATYPRTKVPAVTSAPCLACNNVLSFILIMSEERCSPAPRERQGALVTAEPEKILHPWLFRQFVRPMTSYPSVHAETDSGIRHQRFWKAE